MNWAKLVWQKKTALYKIILLYQRGCFEIQFMEQLSSSGSRWVFQAQTLLSLNSWLKMGLNAVGHWVGGRVKWFQNNISTQITHIWRVYTNTHLLKDEFPSLLTVWIKSVAHKFLFDTDFKNEWISNDFIFKVGMTGGKQKGKFIAVYINSKGRNF